MAEKFWVKPEFFFLSLVNYLSGTRAPKLVGLSGKRVLCRVVIHVVYLVAQNHYRVNGKLKPKCTPWKWSFGGNSLKFV